mmetsp:Transcript_130635/g.225938  ORF Transcript_130635/g.225938 Transcript_130635/m.225938 type:complete len:262 (+) Transcript_130635:603-1388(+)
MPVIAITLRCRLDLDLEALRAANTDCHFATSACISTKHSSPIRPATPAWGIPMFHGRAREWSRCWELRIGQSFAILKEVAHFYSTGRLASAADLHIKAWVAPHSLDLIGEPAGLSLGVAVAPDKVDALPFNAGLVTQLQPKADHWCYPDTPPNEEHNAVCIEWARHERPIGAVQVDSQVAGPCERSERPGPGPRPHVFYNECHGAIQWGAGGAEGVGLEVRDAWDPQEEVLPSTKAYGATVCAGNDDAAPPTDLGQLDDSV